MTYPRSGMDLKSPLVDGVIEDWDLFEKLLDHVYSHQLRTESEKHPLMISENSWNTHAKREQLTEILFEKYKVPALYLCKSGVLTAFSRGLPHALVVDAGAESTSITPVYDGFCLYNATRRSTIAGNVITEEFRRLIEEQTETEVMPLYKIKSKVAVGEGEAAKVTLRATSGLTTNFHNYMKNEVVRDFQASVGRVAERAYHEESLATLPSTLYEFPSGYNCSYVVERYKVPELFFNPLIVPGAAERISNSVAATPEPDGAVETPANGTASAVGAAVARTTGLHDLISESIKACDVDIHSTLWQNIVITGGASLFPGFQERLTSELSIKAQPSNKVKSIFSGNGNERITASWTGGSILASLGSFQQMWFSRQEYAEDGGASSLNVKCA